MKRHLITILLLGTISFLSGCNAKDPELEAALEAAGENRPELEKVLTHYQNDSLKYKAARFLIANMPGHFSYGGKALDTYLFSIDSIFRTGGNAQEVNRQADRWIKQYEVQDRLEIQEDVRHIKAEFLIDNIDRALEDWKKPRNAHLDFAHFCEYLLPYRIANEPLEYWRDMLAGKYRKIENMGYFDGTRASAYWACSFVNDRLRESHGGSAFRLHHSFLPLSYSTLDILNYGTCKEFALLTTFAMRGKGIPVSIDFTPQWAHLPAAHYWNVVYVNRGRNIIFEPLGANPGERHREEITKAKVYRYCYAINKNSLAYQHGQEPIPPFFRNLFLLDVTSEYSETTDITIPLNLPSEKRKFAYLHVFDNQEWQPVHFGKVKRGKATFTNMEKDVVYLPGYYIDEEVEQCCYPLLLDLLGNIHTLEPDSVHTHSMRLHRKYPLSNRMIDYSAKMIGGRIQASQDSLFTNPETFHVIYRNPIAAFDTASVNPQKKQFRYWRYLAPNGSFGQIAELQFFVSDSLSPLQGKHMGTPGPIENCFDGDPLTFYEDREADGRWTGIGLPQPVAIERVVYAPRNDDNHVFPGHEYELFYRGKTSWISLGVQKATNTFVEYTCVPSNALFLLRDWTKGKEERIFTWEEGKQRWW